MPRDTVRPPRLQELPGHQIRRLHQIAVAIFLQDAEPFGITPVQYAALQAIGQQPDIDQRTLAGRAGLDTSTVAGVIDRLEARRLVQRTVAPTDRRVRLLRLTEDGHKLLDDFEPALQQSQARILSPLDAAQRAQFMALLNLLVDENNQHSRAPVPVTVGTAHEA